MKIKKLLFSLLLALAMFGIGSLNAEAQTARWMSFTHGAENGEAVATITSTHTENHMQINMQLSFWDGGSGYPSGTAYGVSWFKLKSGFNWWRSGRSTADYFVNYQHVHTTLNAFPF